MANSSSARPTPSRAATLVGFATIGIVLGSSAAAFAYTAGWLSPGRLTPERLVDALSDRGGNPIGHRRNHAKGICFTGQFEANGAGSTLSRAPMLTTGSYPVTGRFAIATGNPKAPDASGRVRSLAIRITAPDGQEWRSGMNSSPVFPVATPSAFYELTRAMDLAPANGRPDPAAMSQFAATHPETAAFAEWAKSAPWTASYADEAYNSLNAFHFTNALGVTRTVRWSLQPTEPVQTISVSDRSRLTPDFLEQDLEERLRHGPLRWHLVIAIAAPGDPSNDATRAWPTDREKVDTGTLVVARAEPEADGPCRDLNFDPLILPSGITPSDDPLLPARSSAYANSFDRRTAEAEAYPRTPVAAGGRH